MEDEGTYISLEGSEEDRQAALAALERLNKQVAALNQRVSERKGPLQSHPSVRKRRRRDARASRRRNFPR